jgi:hypothetical protein
MNEVNLNDMIKNLFKRKIQLRESTYIKCNYHGCKNHKPFNLDYCYDCMYKIRQENQINKVIGNINNG